MDSRWKLPLPQGKDETVNVVVCYHSKRWIPLTCFRYSEALILFRRASIKGKELLLFPASLNLENENILLSEFSSCRTQLGSSTYYF
jgi:hypothetical protein